MCTLYPPRDGNPTIPQGSRDFPTKALSTAIVFDSTSTSAEVQRECSWEQEQEVCPVVVHQLQKSGGGKETFIFIPFDSEF